MQGQQLVWKSDTPFVFIVQYKLEIRNLTTRAGIEGTQGAFASLLHIDGSPNPAPLLKMTKCDVNSFKRGIVTDGQPMLDLNSVGFNYIRGPGLDLNQYSTASGILNLRAI